MKIPWTWPTQDGFFRLFWDENSLLSKQHCTSAGLVSPGTAIEKTAAKAASASLDAKGALHCLIHSEDGLLLYCMPDTATRHILTRLPSRHALRDPLILCCESVQLYYVAHNENDALIFYKQTGNHWSGDRVYECSGDDQLHLHHAMRLYGDEVALFFSVEAEGAHALYRAVSSDGIWSIERLSQSSAPFSYVQAIALPGGDEHSAWQSNGIWCDGRRLPVENASAPCLLLEGQTLCLSMLMNGSPATLTSTDGRIWKRSVSAYSGDVHRLLLPGGLMMPCTLLRTPPFPQPHLPDAALRRAAPALHSEDNDRFQALASSYEALKERLATAEAQLRQMQIQPPPPPSSATIPPSVRDSLKDLDNRLQALGYALAHLETRLTGNTDDRAGEE